MKRQPYLLAICATLAIGSISPALAQTFPEKPIRWIVPFTAGGGTDVTARLIAKAAGPSFNGHQPFIDNKPGGATVIGTAALASSKPNGYTIGSVNESLAVNQFLLNKVPYKPGDLEYISALVKIPMILTVRPDFPANNLSEFLAVIKKKNDKSWNFGSWGVGSTAHLVGERLGDKVGADVTHVPFQGASQMVLAVSSGQIDFCFCEISSTIPFVQSGKVKAFAISTKSRSPAVPNLPPLADAVPGLEAFAWNGIATPKGLPAAVKNVLVTGVRNAVNDPKVKEDMISKGFVVWASTPAEMEAHLKFEAQVSEEIIKKRNIKLQ